MGNMSRIVAFYTEPAKFEINDGIVNICIRSGNDVTQMAWTICAFAKSIERGCRALERFRAGDNTIIVED